MGTLITHKEAARLLSHIDRLESELASLRAAVTALSLATPERPLQPLRDADWAAEVLGVTKQTIYYLARINGLPCVRLSTQSIKFCETAIRAFIDAGGNCRAAEGENDIADK